MASKATPPEQKKALRVAIARQSDALRVLESQREAAERELRRLEGALESLEGTCPNDRLDAPDPGIPAPVTSAEKVALFRSLFRGRDDVYPKFWANSRTGRTGYAPGCGNEWVRGVCEKPRVRCGECPNQAFLAVSDRVILDHLQGRHVVGV